MIREQIESHLAENGISKSWLAKQLGISPQLLQSWLKGSMKVDSLEKICKILNLQIIIKK